MQVLAWGRTQRTAAHGGRQEIRRRMLDAADFDLAITLQGHVVRRVSETIFMPFTDCPSAAS